jgi:hypothetical protein
VLDRVNGDKDFRARFESDTSSALAELELSYAEHRALTATDEDALRRMAAANVDVESARDRSWLSRLLCTRWFCGPGGTRDFNCPKQP